MSDFVFTHPGVKFKEKDLSFVTRQIGLTFLGLVGETPKGPAFEPIKIEDKGDFRRRLGRQSIKRFPNGELQYQLPYVANAFLDESNELFVTRVLGLSGYEAGKAWAITLDAGYDPETLSSDSTVTTTGVTFTLNSYLGVSLMGEGDVGTSIQNFEKNAGTFSWDEHSFVVTSYNPLDGSGVVTDTVTDWRADAYSGYEDMVLAVLRSRGRVEDVNNGSPNTVFDVSDSATVVISGNTTTLSTGDLFGDFKVVITDGPIVESFVVSLNPRSSNFISKVFGTTAKDKKTKLWVEATYPDLLNKLDRENLGYAINDSLVVCDDSFYNDYTKTQYKTPETPWVVSQIIGDTVDRLFKFISISDGDSANQEIKISILNIDPTTGEFDVMVRDFNDTDDTPIVLESYTRCTMAKGNNNFVGNRIGTSDGEYQLISRYVMIELAPEFDVNSFPAGFEGYMLNKYDATPPKIFYKTKYNVAENLNRVFLGISSTEFPSNGINQNLFNYNGWYGGLETDINYFEKSKGFHLDSGATGTYYDGDILIGEFDTGIGNFQTSDDVLLSGAVYENEATRKFTLVPAGGFDGWNVHRNGRSHGDDYGKGRRFDGVGENETPTNDFQAWETAINTFNNPEEISINLFSTPGINWLDNSLLVKEVIDMIEKERADSLYVIDSPDINIPQTIGINKNDVLAAKNITDLLKSVDLDSNYSCTYFPWLQMRDTENGVNVYIPPTGEVLAAMAFTDKVKFPWFAPAGLQRGVTNARKSKYRLSSDARRILYINRINPIADFANTGTAIFGQKTLQVKESALDRVNVRRLLLQIKLLISNIAIRLVFEQNDQTTIDQFLAKATPILDTIKRERGLYDFKVKMDDSNNTPESRDRNELYGEIFLKPTRAVEYIGITFTITPSGASFDDL